MSTTDDRTAACEAWAAELAMGLRAVGLRPGGAALVHSSLRSFGQVPGGADAVIDGLLEALGPDGALLMCAHSYASVSPQQPRFDVRHTPSCVGLIPETFRQRRGVTRSLHPTHSVCGLGRRVHTLLGEHDRDQTPCGPRSPYRRLAQTGGQILMLGCGLGPNTSMHGVEELVEPPYLFREQTVAFTLVDAHGGAREVVHRVHDFRGWRQRYDRVASLLDEPALRRGTVLKAEVWVIDAAVLWERAERALRDDPMLLVEKVV